MAVCRDVARRMDAVLATGRDAVRMWQAHLKAMETGDTHLDGQAPLKITEFLAAYETLRDHESCAALKVTSAGAEAAAVPSGSRQPTGNR